uniref:Uncharacterized protein n=1 Tax=Vespula pensylvanica TaxID=30213 RepID=A0A834KL11_VESPE|nr:hypothetical protein H0235_014395 [Vespula pensylvanica]
MRVRVRARERESVSMAACCRIVKLGLITATNYPAVIRALSERYPERYPPLPGLYSMEEPSHHHPNHYRTLEPHRDLTRDVSLIATAGWPLATPTPPTPHGCVASTLHRLRMGAARLRLIYDPAGYVFEKPDSRTLGTKQCDQSNIQDLSRASRHFEGSSIPPTDCSLRKDKLLGPQPLQSTPHVCNTSRKDEYPLPLTVGSGPSSLKGFHPYVAGGSYPAYIIVEPRELFPIPDSEREEGCSLFSDNVSRIETALKQSINAVTRPLETPADGNTATPRRPISSDFGKLLLRPRTTSGIANGIGKLGRGRRERKESSPGPLCFRLWVGKFGKGESQSTPPKT